MNMYAIPKVILVFSGKRKSGKDYITEKLHERFVIADTVDDYNIDILNIF